MRGRRKTWMYLAEPLWTPSLEFCAQSAHLFSGWAVVLTAAHLLGPGWAAAGFAAYAVVKEGLVDPLVEGDDVWPDGCVDCSFYLLGALVGVLAFLWR